jgi:hypothetical protein
MTRGHFRQTRISTTLTDTILLRRGYELAYVETRHLDAGDETVIVWTRPARPDDLDESEIPF